MSSHFSVASAPSDTIERRLSDDIVEFLSAEPESLYQWFAKYRTAGVGFGTFDTAMAHFLAWRFPRAPIFELGCGMGQLSLLAAAFGHPATGLETITSTFDVTRRLREHLLARWPALASRYQVLNGYFPKAGGEYVTPETVVVSTNIYYRMKDDVFDELMDRIRAARAVVVSARYFLTPERCPHERTEKAAQDYLVEEFRSRGWKAPSVVYEWTSIELGFMPDRILCYEK